MAIANFLLGIGAFQMKRSILSFLDDLGLDDSPDLLMSLGFLFLQKIFKHLII
jgi:hypothetical protein